MKRQLASRLGVAHVRDTVAQFAEGGISLSSAMQDLGIGKTRLYGLRTSFLAAKAQGRGADWVPGASGGDHMPRWPEEVRNFLREVLSKDSNADRFSYAFAAAEAGRRFGFRLDRAQVRKWALAQGIKSFRQKPHVSPHTRRWQRTCVGELWQLDATPDYFLGRGGPQLHLIDMLDDCSRMQVGCGLYARESLGAYLHMFHGVFGRFGIPLQVYVDKASFFTSGGAGVTQLEERLRFFGVSFVLANTPEAKGKIERVHQVWQDRLPRSFSHEGFTAATPLEVLNAHAQALVDYRNSFELHREIGMTPGDAWDGAVREGRNKLRAVPSDGWWELVWAIRSRIVIGARGKVFLDGMWCPTECPNGTRAYLYRHVDGTVSVALNKPTHSEPPKVVFTTNTRLLRSQR